jgi:hypothetical protein
MNIVLKLSGKKIIWILLLWQFISVGLMSVGVWPQEVAWFNLSLLLVFLLFGSVFEALVLFLVSIPFFVVLPNPYLTTLSTWRLLSIALFTIFVVKFFLSIRKNDKKTTREILGDFVKPFMRWDAYLIVFMVVAFVSSFFARYPEQSLRQIIFLINTYLIYIVVIHVVKTKEQARDLIKYGAVSLAIIVALGYVQLLITLFVTQYYFWQYWAIMVSKVYYGLDLANVLIYSNSWFSYTGEIPNLRMFSIMPDSHSFGVIAILLIGFLISILFFYPKGRKGFFHHPKELFASKRYYLWYALRFSGLAVIFSGTRGLWVGMIPALLVSLFLYWKNIGRPVMRRASIAFAFVILFFVVSPFINQALYWFRVNSLEENFLDRAASIYDLNEQSNVGRLVIWKDSLTYATTHPFGVGYGNFIVSLVPNIPEGTSFEQVGQLENLRYNLPQKFVTAHSLYLNILVELGIVGLFVFLMFIATYFKEIYHFIMANRNSTSAYSAFTVSFALIFLWILAYGVFDVTLFNDKVLLYVFISLGLSAVIIRKRTMFSDENLIEQKK